jgi:pyruvate kinase
MKLSFLLLSSTAFFTNAFAPHSQASIHQIQNTKLQQRSSALFASSMLNPKTVPIKSVTTVAAVPKMAQRWRKSTKQVATLGPASSNMEMIEKLFLSGADVFRLNFSHGSQDQKKELLLMIRVGFESPNLPRIIMSNTETFYSRHCRSIGN